MCDLSFGVHFIVPWLCAHIFILTYLQVLVLAEGIRMDDLKNHRVLVVIVSIHNVLIRAEADNKSCSYNCTIHIPMEEKQKFPADSGCKI
jgi:hypothetical protein